MEKNNKNKKIEELTDEQLKQVAGGAGKSRCASVPDSICVKLDNYCNCTKCAEGYVLVSGKCEYQG